MKTFMLMLLSISSPENDTLRDRIAARIASVDGIMAVAFHDLMTGKQLLMNEREMFHAASTMKTPVMIELIRQADQGIVRLDDSLLVKNSFSIVDGSPCSMDLGDDAMTRCTE